MTDGGHNRSVSGTQDGAAGSLVADNEAPVWQGGRGRRACVSPPLITCTKLACEWPLANDQERGELRALKIASERLIDDLGNGQVIEVSLASDRLNPATFDMEGGALGLAAGITRLEQGGFALLPPGHEFLEVTYHCDKHIIVYMRYTFCGHRYLGIGRRSQVELLKAITHGRAGETKPLGDLSWGEAFSGEGLKLGIVDLGAAMGVPPWLR